MFQQARGNISIRQDGYDVYDDGIEEDVLEVEKRRENCLIYCEFLKLYSVSLDDSI